MVKIFGDICRLTLATNSATWDVNYRGPGFIKMTSRSVEVHTEEGVDVMFDRRGVVGFQCLPYAPEQEETEDEETE